MAGFAIRLTSLHEYGVDKVNEKSWGGRGADEGRVGVCCLV